MTTINHKDIWSEAEAALHFCCQINLCIIVGEN